MDLSIIPRDFQYASPMQLKFFKSATIREICVTYNKYRTQKDNPRVKATIESTGKLLSILEEKGFAYSYYDGASSWLCYDVIEDNIKVSSTLSIRMDNHAEKIVSAKAEQMALEAVLPKKSENDFTKIVVNTDEEAADEELLQPDLKQSNPLIWRLKVATKYTNTLKSAIRRGLDFNLDFTDIEDLVSQHRCFYSGVEFDAEHVLTFDRVDHAKGYIKGNVVACTTQANALKNSLFEMTDGVFNDIATLKRFVDIIYIGMSKEKDPLADLLLFT